MFNNLINKARNAYKLLVPPANIKQWALASIKIWDIVSKF